MKEKPEN